jgi:putative glutamine amidotransferase
VTSDPVRHYFEVSFLFHLIGGSRNSSMVPLLEENPDYMVTGFCLGMQSMNVAAGGTLYQDIPAQIYNSFKPETNILIGRANLHRNYWQNITDDRQLMGYNLHRISFTDNDFFNKTVGISGNIQPLIFSSHHQSVKDVGAGLGITALSPDGKVIEGLVHTKYPHVFSVQFHPEVSGLYEDRNEVKFSPEDKPETIHSMLDSESLMFHTKYWSYISGIIRGNSE